MPICDKCGANIYEGASFCPGCGDPITESDYATHAVSTTVPVAELTFAYSSSRSYDGAVELAQRFPTYSVAGEGKDAVHTVSIPVTDMQAILNLFEIISGWKSSRLMIDGQRCSKKDLSYGGLGCYAERQRTGASATYCWGTSTWLSLVGCKRLDAQTNVLSVDTGAVVREGDEWRVRKDVLSEHLRRKVTENRFCPLLKTIRWDKFVEALPDKLPYEGDQYWVKDPLWADSEYTRGVAPSSAFYRKYYRNVIPEPLLSEVVALKETDERNYRERKQAMERYEREIQEYTRAAQTSSTYQKPRASGCGTSLFLVMAFGFGIAFWLCVAC